MTKLGMILTFAWLGLRHWIATWLRWIAHLIDNRNTTLGQCECSAIQRPWPVPRARHSPVCRFATTTRWWRG